MQSTPLSILLQTANRPIGQILCIFLNYQFAIVSVFGGLFILLSRFQTVWEDRGAQGKIAYGLVIGVQLWTDCRTNHAGGRIKLINKYGRDLGCILLVNTG